MGTIKPITPDDVQDKKNESIPDLVIEAFNEMIVANWNGSSASFQQDAVIERIMTKLDIDRGTVFSKRYLDVEPLFEAQGWKVEYDKPAYNETYAANFTFKKRRGFH